MNPSGSGWRPKVTQREGTTYIRVGDIPPGQICIGKNTGTLNYRGYGQPYIGIDTGVTNIRQQNPQQEPSEESSPRAPSPQASSPQATSPQATSSSPQASSPQASSPQASSPQASSPQASSSPQRPSGTNYFTTETNGGLRMDVNHDNLTVSWGPDGKMIVSRGLSPRGPGR